MNQFPYDATKVVTALWEAALGAKDQMSPDAIRAKFLAVEELDKLHNADIVAVLEGLKEASLFKPKWVHIDDINEAIKKHGGK